ncbi:MAG TPA: carbonic anhydrase [Vampirovibrionales bacterium]
MHKKSKKHILHSSQSIKAFLVFLSCLFLVNCSNSKQTKEVSSNKAPLERLLEGNKRFQKNHSKHPNQSMLKRKELLKGQKPYAVIVTCSDSRVPPALIFDTGFGDLFVIRTAGNVIGDLEIGSIEYAVDHLGTKLVMVLGHQSCGAVKASLDHHYDHQKEHGYIQEIVKYIDSEEEEQKLYKNGQKLIPLEQAVEANVRHGIHLLNSSQPVIDNLVKEKGLEIVGAVYQLETGKVELLED